MEAQGWRSPLRSPSALDLRGFVDPKRVTLSFTYKTRDAAQV